MSDNYQHIRCESADGVLIVTILESKISEYQVAEGMGKEMLAAIHDSGSSNVVIDMTTVQYMSSVGYMPFLSVHGQVKAMDGKMVMCCMSPFVKEIFEKTRLLINPKSKKSLFYYADSIADAQSVISE